MQVRPRQGDELQRRGAGLERVHQPGRGGVPERVAVASCPRAVERVEAWRAEPPGRLREARVRRLRAGQSRDASVPRSTSSVPRRRTPTAGRAVPRAQPGGRRGWRLSNCGGTSTRIVSVPSIRHTMACRCRNARKSTGDMTRRQVDEHVLVVSAIDPDRELVGEEPKRLLRPRPEHQVRKVPRLDTCSRQGAPGSSASCRARWRARSAQVRRAPRPGPSVARSGDRSARVVGSGCRAPRRDGRAACCGGGTAGRDASPQAESHVPARGATGGRPGRRTSVRGGCSRTCSTCRSTNTPACSRTMARKRACRGLNPSPWMAAACSSRGSLKAKIGTALPQELVRESGVTATSTTTTGASAADGETGEP